MTLRRQILLVLVIFSFTFFFTAALILCVCFVRSRVRPLLPVASVHASVARVRPLPHARAPVSCCRCVTQLVHPSAAAGALPHTCIRQLLQVCYPTHASVRCCRCVTPHVHPSDAAGASLHTCARQLLQVRYPTRAPVSSCRCVSSQVLDALQYQPITKQGWHLPSMSSLP